MTSDKTTVRGPAARRAREQADLSQSKAAAELDPDPEHLSRVKAFLQRLETREQTEIDDDTAQAIADIYGVDVDDLAQEILWVPVSTRAVGLRDIGLHLFCYSAPEKADQARELMRHLGVGKGIDLVPLDRNGIVESVRLNVPDEFIKDVLLVDADPEALKSAILLERYLGADPLMSDEDTVKLADGLHRLLNLPFLVRMQSARVKRVKETGVASDAVIADQERSLRMLARMIRLYTVDRLDQAGVEGA